MDEALVKIRPLEDLSEWENSLLVGESNATESRSEVEADWRLRVKDSARFEIVLSKTATAIASKPTGLCVRGELSKQASQLGGFKTTLVARLGLGCCVRVRIRSRAVESGRRARVARNNTWNAHLDSLFPEARGTFVYAEATVPVLVGREALGETVPVAAPAVGAAVVDGIVGVLGVFAWDGWWWSTRVCGWEVSYGEDMGDYNHRATAAGAADRGFEDFEDSAVESGVIKYSKVEESGKRGARGPTRLKGQRAKELKD
ncbi:hypothetical protein F4803DRAFT_556132 [Xylaria telfairii]|nr:hypothetical protein F4803DRAFT_556132 [Xylaria telfairii]